MYQYNEECYFDKMSKRSDSFSFQPTEIPCCKKSNKIFPMRMLQRCSSQTPSISLKLKFINNINSEDNSHQIASQNIDNKMIPPTFFEIIQSIPQRIFYHLERHRHEHQQFDIPAYQRFSKPTQKMRNCEPIHSIVECLFGYAATLTIGDLFVIHKFY